MDSNKIRAIINSQDKFLRDTYNVKSIGVFGSVVRGENTEKSDVDLLVEFSSPVGMFKFLELENYLSKILDRKVDLVTKKALKSSIKDEILREVVYA